LTKPHVRIEAGVMTDVEFAVSVKKLKIFYGAQTKCKKCKELIDIEHVVSL
jgi:hypothetical protein